MFIPFRSYVASVIFSSLLVTFLQKFAVKEDFLSLWNNKIISYILSKYLINVKYVIQYVYKYYNEWTQIKTYSNTWQHFVVCSSTEYNASLQVKVQYYYIKKDLRCNTVIQKYFWLITVTQSEDINKEDPCILIMFTKRLVSANTSVQF